MARSLMYMGLARHFLNIYLVLINRFITHNTCDRFLRMLKLNPVQGFKMTAMVTVTFDNNQSLGFATVQHQREGYRYKNKYHE